MTPSQSVYRYRLRGGRSLASRLDRLEIAKVCGARAFGEAVQTQSTPRGVSSSRAEIGFDCRSKMALDPNDSGLFGAQSGQ